MPNGSVSLLEHLRRCLAELMAKAVKTAEDEQEILAIRKQIDDILAA